MKTKELIEELQKADPEGNSEVVVGNRPIYFVESLPAYYDGRMHCLVQDPSKFPCYNIIGYKIAGEGSKVRLNIVDLDDLLFDDPDLPVDLSELSDKERTSWEKEIRKKRQQIKKEEQEDEICNRCGGVHNNSCPDPR